jgi:soluble lytic murein transglycosylase
LTLILKDIRTRATALACVTVFASAGFAAIGFASTALIALAPGEVLAAPQPVPMPPRRPPAAGAPAGTVAAGTVAEVRAAAKSKLEKTKLEKTKLEKAKLEKAKDEAGLTFDAATSVPKADLDAVKQAVDLARRGKSQEAGDLQQRIEDPLARKVVEWAILRSDDSAIDASRYRNFLTANPNWPSQTLIRRRAEALLWQDHANLATVRAVAGDHPVSAKGRFALGRALMEAGDRAAAEAVVRDAWRTEALARDAEDQVLQTFGDLITRADEKARMDIKLYAGENDAALRAAQRLGGDAVAVARMRVAFNQRTSGSADLMQSLSDEVQDDPLVIFSHIQALRRAEKTAEAAQMLIAAPRDPAALVDADEWWVERRLVARKLLDLDDAKTAYEVVRDIAAPSKENYRIEHEFTAGWIALRFLKDPARAAEHFARMGEGVTNPISLAKAGYWRGRAAEAAGRSHEARGYYETAARYSTAYYGQLARAKIGRTDIPLAPLPLPPAPARAGLAQNEVVRAMDILYAAGERDLVIGVMADLGEHATDTAMLAALAELATHNDDARSVLLVGKAALGRGYAFDRYAFPAFGLPQYKPVAPQVDNAIVYAIVRQESAFNARDVSRANALGLMQVTPEAGQEIARKFNVRYDQKRLLYDDVYNMQIGAAELHEKIARFRGSFVLAFAGYNAGPGRVKEWVEKYGDPRESGVDAVDWVERIPFAETRNYVQRIIENIQVYRARFDGKAKLQIEADLRRGAE